MTTKKDTTPKPQKSFDEMTITEIVKKYLGDAHYFSNYTGWRIEDVVATIGTLSSDIKTKNIEITYLKDKVEFLERIINQVFKQEKS